MCINILSFLNSTLYALCFTTVTSTVYLQMDIYFRQLLSDVSTHKHSLQIDPEILNGHPVLNDVCGVG